MRIAAPKKNKWATKYAWQRKDRAAHPEKYIEYRKRERAKRGDVLNQRCRDYVRKLREEIISAYGGKCVCCDESAPEFLTIDHINGGGGKHRETIGRTGGQSFYIWLRRQGFPKDEFRLLCYNCNCARGKYGYCPHEKARLAVSK